MDIIHNSKLKKYILSFEWEPEPEPEPSLNPNPRA